ncbi:MAG: Rha family transcriptional regulator [Aeromonas sp.]
MNHNNSLLVPDHLISINGDKLVTTSLKIAEVFGKRHDDVLKKISNLECSDHFRLRNFAETVYYRKNPSSGEDIATKMWNITKDGFVFIAMGFTGKKAAQFKEFYINAFNWMAEQLTKSQPAKKPRKPKALQNGLSIEQQQSIKGLVMGRVANVPVDLKSKAILRCWAALKTHFKMSYKEIAPELFTEAVSLIAILPLEGELLPNEMAAPAAPLHIHFPAETASPHDRKFGNDWFTARTILDERNRAPEQELLALLEASGFDVTGASIRIHAMYGIIKQFLGVQRELAIASHHSSTITDILYSATRERGDNVSFTGDTCGKTYGGQSTRTLPRR